MQRCDQYHGYTTKLMLQATTQLIGLLSVLPWEVMVEFLQRLREGKVSGGRWPGPLQKVLSPLSSFTLGLYQAIYWHLIEKIAEQLKSGELRNPTIYEFNPDVVYVPPRQRAKSKSAGRTEQPTLPTGIPPPEENSFAEK